MPLINVILDPNTVFVSMLKRNHKKYVRQTQFIVYHTHKIEFESKEQTEHVRHFHNSLKSLTTSKKKTFFA